MPGSILGNAVRRREDPRLITGAGRFVDDRTPEDCLHAAFVRSPLAHARIGSIDTAAASEALGVVAVFTAADLGLRPQLAFPLIDEVFARPPLAADVVRFAGDPVAVVLATSRAGAADAAQLVEVDYDRLPVVASLAAAAADGAPVLFPEAGTNMAFAFDTGEADTLEGAAVVVRQRMFNQRLAPVPLEGNAVLAVPDGEGLTLYVSTQHPFQLRDSVAGALGLPEHAVRCIVEDVGGGFGAKTFAQAEHIVVAAAARRLGRPVKFVETRSENFVAMKHGRAQLQEVAIGATADGRLTGIEITALQDAGAYPEGGAALPILTGQMTPAVYAFPRARFVGHSYATNTTPTGYYRGAGRPEATAAVERAMDLLAAELNLDPAELRRRNLVPAGDFPYTTPSNVIYDSGDYKAALEQALTLAGYDELREEQGRRRQAGERSLLGIGLACYVEITAPMTFTEYGEVELLEDGRFQAKTGTMGTGQGHATTFAMIVADRLGVPVEAVDVLEGDTGRVPRGEGTSGSRSMQLGGSALAAAAGELLERAKEQAARLLEADPADLEPVEGGLGVKGVPGRAVSWSQLAALHPGLRAESDFFSEGSTFPFGAHVAAVEVDGETGEVRFLKYVAVDDCGTVLNPLLAEGQVHGGIAQGIAQALFEEVTYDDMGTPRTTTLLDYSVPTCNEMPPLVLGRLETPTPNNPLGAKGIGESGTIGSTPAVWNAVIDALAHLGVRHIDMPCSPDRVWRAIQEASPALNR
jgi:carbon-monoxide dehydrogenase large subunit